MKLSGRGGACGRRPGWVAGGIAGLLWVLSLAGCGTAGPSPFKPGAGGFGQYPAGGGLYVSATFGPDGRLWRVVPEKQHVYVDYSTDLGKTFSIPVAINPDRQKIKAGAEGRPSIAVDPANRVYVVYTAEAALPNSVFFSVSDAGGRQFSRPAELSRKAAEAGAFQGRLAVDPKGRVFAFWHDERDRSDYRVPGNSVYYATLDPAATAPANFKAAADLCECCRIAASFDRDGRPVLLTRFIYDGHTRDHGLTRLGGAGGPGESWRVTSDGWNIDACPEHGPALSIGPDGTYYMAWFTLGQQRQGLFYAHSSDLGRHFSAPEALGDPAKLPGHADIASLGERVVLAWKEFDGENNLVRVRQSRDGGKTWAAPSTVAVSASEADYPFLLSDGRAIFLSWNSPTEGYRLFRID